MRHIERIVVDECVGLDSPLVDLLRQRLGQSLGERKAEILLLGAAHPGIPDIEILDKLLDVNSVLLTVDRVLHNRALARGFRSFVDTPETGLTDRRLAHVSVPDKRLPVANGALRDNYHHVSSPDAQSIRRCTYEFLSEKQIKQFRTKRRRIRAHFGSPDNILASALTIGQRRTAQGLIGGYVLKVDARDGVKALFPASESYFFDPSGKELLQATCWALLHLFELLLQEYPVSLYITDGAALARCKTLIQEQAAAATDVERMAKRLLAAVARPTPIECTKGRFFDRLNEKLGQLTRFTSNELVAFDLGAFAATFAANERGDMGPEEIPF
jgi:hypothetical protein